MKKQLTGATEIREIDIAGICSKLLAGSTSAKGAIENMAAARNLVTLYPDSYDANITLMQVLEKSREKTDMLDRWLEMSKKFPDCTISQRHCVRWFFRRHQKEDAEVFIKSHCAYEVKTPEQAVDKANLHLELKDFESFDRILTTSLERFPDNSAIRIILSRSLKQRGKIAKSWHIFEPVSKQEKLPPSAVVLGAELKNAIRALNKVAPKEWERYDNTSIFAFKTAISMFSKRKVRAVTRGELGPTSLITGSLAAGGAERQMLNTAINLEKCRKNNQQIHGVKLSGPFEVMVTTLNSAAKKDFLLPVAKEAGLEVRQMQDIRPQDLDEICPENEVLSALLHIQPLNATFGIHRLVQYFRKQETEIAYLWQDGAVLQAALAALIAEVPRIIIGVRGLPPNVRRHLFREEYEDMYRALAKVPGVCFASNGYAAAVAYAEWLEISIDRFIIIPNGIAPLIEKDCKQDKQAWEQFEKETADATHTVGGVFRFETDKRPLLWVLFAREFLHRHPKARFLLVGGGKFLEEAKARAIKFGIDKRVLFVGQSSNVPYWMKKIEVFLLLSLFEGLPNVLIEAQMMGVPVVSTPAGSAEDTFIEGETGLILSEVENPTVAEMCEKVETVFEMRQKNENLPEMAKDIANSKFSIQTMTKNTVSLLYSDCEKKSPKK
jgi:glycosyltransferase involved in cell wall biosynthesis